MLSRSYKGYAAGLLSDQNIESNCGRLKAFERSTFLLSHPIGIEAL
jgi:hypothetical protein